MRKDWQLDTETEGGVGNDSITFRRWSRGEGVERTLVKHRPGKLTVGGSDAADAAAFVQTADIGEEIPHRDAVCELAVTAGDDTVRWEVGHPEQTPGGDGCAGHVSVTTDEPGVTATAFLATNGAPAEVRFSPASALPRVATGAGEELTGRAVTHDIDDAPAAPFGDTVDEARTTCQTVAYAGDDGRDVLVTGDPTEVNELNVDAALVVRPWPAQAVDLGAVDAAVDATVVTVDGEELGGGEAAEELGRTVASVRDERRIAEEIPRETIDPVSVSFRQHGR